ncbi:MAG: hypothetical protein HRS57_00740 [Mycoplasmataceae bacterium]|nr:hypothetical protein [Mycoplasmataceae bacterium]
MRNFRKSLLLPLTAITAAITIPVVSLTSFSLEENNFLAVEDLYVDEVSSPSAYNANSEITYTNDSGNDTAWSQTDSLKNDKFVAKTPEGRYIDVFFTNENWTMTWDPAEISDITYSEYTYSHSGISGTSWDKTNFINLSIDPTTGTQFVTHNKSITFIESKDASNNFVETDIVISTDTDPFELFDVDGTTALFSDGNPLPIYFSDGAGGKITENLMAVDWIYDWTVTDNTYSSRTSESQNYDILAQAKGYTANEIYNANASEVVSIKNVIDNLNDVTTIDQVALKSYLDTELENMYTAEGIYGMQTSTVEPELEKMIYAYLTSSSTDSVVDSNDLTINFTWNNISGTDNTIIGEEETVDLEFTVKETGEWIDTTILTSPTSKYSYSYNIDWIVKPVTPTPPDPTDPTLPPDPTDPTTPPDTTDPTPDPGDSSDTDTGDDEGSNTTAIIAGSVAGGVVLVSGAGFAGYKFIYKGRLGKK